MNLTKEEWNKLLDDAIKKITEEEKEEDWTITKSTGSGLVKYKAGLKKSEEKCCQCSRMKDVGDKCWWCGCK